MMCTSPVIIDLITDGYITGKYKMKKDMFEMYYTLGIYNGLTHEAALSYASEMVEHYS